MSDAAYPSRFPSGLDIPGITGQVEIGSGGFGVVYRAEEEDLGRTVAVKILSGNLDEAGRIRFDRERRAMGTLSGHPNIVTIYRSGYTPSGNAYLVMEYLAPGSLAARMHQFGALAWDEALTLGVQLAGALETAHRAGVLHRDIKPANILLSNLGSAKLCDFGIARLQGAFETRSSTVTASLAHAPPEVVSGQRPDARSDVYSLASTLYELATGRPPFVEPTDESMMQILARIGRDPVPRCDDQLVPWPMFAAIEAAMAKDPADRPATAHAFGLLLTDAQQQLGLATTRIPIVEHPAAGADGSGNGAPSQPVPVTYPSRPVPSGDIPATARSAPPTAPPTAPTPPSSPGFRPDPSATGDPAWLSGAPSGGVSQATGPAGSGAGVGSVTTTSRVTTLDRRWAIPAAIAAVVVLGLVVTLVVRGGGGDNTATGDTTTRPTITLNPDGVATTTGPGATTTGASPDAYTSFLFRTDSTGSIEILVPQDWTDIERNPSDDGTPFLAVAPALDAFYDSFSGPGVSVNIYPGTPEPQTLLDQVRDDSTRNQCSAPVSRPFRGSNPGLLELFADCGPDKTRLAHVVMAFPDEDLTALVFYQAPKDRDFDAFQKIVESLVVTKVSP